MGLMIFDCGPTFPSTYLCQAISFPFENVKETIVDAIITYKYRGDDEGNYELYAGNTPFSDYQTEPAACVEQETVITVPVVDFNSDDSINYVVKDGVLNVSMHQVEAGTNGCAKPRNLATVNLQYQFYDCGA